MGSDGLQIGIHCIKALVHTLNEPVLHLHEIGLGGVPDPRPPRGRRPWRSSISMRSALMVCPAMSTAAFPVGSAGRRAPRVRGRCHQASPPFRPYSQTSTGATRVAVAIMR